MTKTLLGSLTPDQFLKHHWQKQALLIPRALPDFTDIISRQVLFELAGYEETQSRLVIQKSKGWEIHHGPFDAKDFKKLPKSNWTLLVQGVNLLLGKGEELLHQFDFIPHARLDDLMISYAPHGGGVGPHFDSYDVFLLQGSGQRRWQISAQDDLTLVPDAPLKILQDFKSEQEWVLGPGDMLYLPPRFAHNGTAVDDDCMTYSIGFRAPSAQELATQFLVYLQDNIRLEGMYSDPDLIRPAHPAAIGQPMLEQVSRMLRNIAWDKDIVSDFLGTYLTEPKAHLFFDPPDEPMPSSQFLRHAKKQGIHLDAKTQLLFIDHTFYINGERHSVTPATASILTLLADRRFTAVPPAGWSVETRNLLYQWYLDGYIGLIEGAESGNGNP